MHELGWMLVVALACTRGSFPALFVGCYAFPPPSCPNLLFRHNPFGLSLMHSRAPQSAGGHGDRSPPQSAALSVNHSTDPRSTAPSAQAAGSPEPSKGSGDMRAVWFRLTDSCLLALHRGDITKWKVDGKTDAIVNAANTRMLGGGGVDGAIHRAAGPDLYDACRKLPIARGIRCPTGDAVITNGYQLPVSKIIHAVGPIYVDDKTSAPLLENAYKRALSLAVENGIEFLAFPAISCGVYDYPHDKAAEIALRTAAADGGCLKEVHFVLFEEGTWVQWLSKANEWFDKVPQ